ncbi:prepilin-type N-terminal cleavage/methylation domain-containing protein [Sulfurospirillum sp. 1612]|uniref:prepilin-type N-terminal cleavage/methylation domain-containing protein n=1 Tax=Sulfurospirillum sp. 1612 TaxID=3094835 RepID=UPI002F925FE8
MQKSAFTMVELIFVIIIIGILASIAVPKLSGITDGAKKTAEIATISAVTTVLESANGEYSINEGSFTWGNKRASSELNSDGYPTFLGTKHAPFSYVLKNDTSKFENVSGTSNGVISGSDYNISIFTGPASNAKNGVSFDTSAPNSDIAGKPDKNDFWLYASYVDSNKSCLYHDKNITSGDFLLIDINGTASTNYSGVSLTCN